MKMIKTKSKRDLRLLNKADGTLLHGVSPRIAAKFLNRSLHNIRTLMYKGVLSSEGSRHQRLILVNSLLAFQPYTQEQHRADASKGSKAWWVSHTKEERHSIMKERQAKVPLEKKRAAQKKATATWLATSTHEKRSETAKLRNAKVTHDELSARGKKGYKEGLAKFTKEELSVRLREGHAKRPSEQRIAAASKAGKAAQAALTPEQRSTRAGANSAAGWAKLKAAAKRLEAIESGAAKKRGAPKKEIAQKIFQRWIELGKPRVTVEISAKLATEFYPTESDPQKLHNRIWATIDRLSPATI